MEIIVLIIIAVSISMDAFSLALAYGTLNLPKNDIKLLSLIVGLYHFFMPLIGLVIGSYILDIIKIKPNFIVLFILSIIGFQMVISSPDEKEINKLKKLEMLLFGFAVSLDSLSIGITLPTITNNHFIACFIFFTFSSLFTYLGLTLGKKISSKIGSYSCKIGGIILILIGILYII